MGGWGDKIFFFVVWGAGMIAAAAPLFVLGPARELSQWTLANVPDLSRRQRLVLTLAPVAAAAAVIATTWTPVVSAVGADLPTAFVTACGLWACVFASRIVRKTARRWLKPLPDVIGVATAAASLLLVAKHNLLTTEPAAGFLFPLAVWGSIKAWLAMKRSHRLTARAAADLTLSLLLGAELVLFLVWLANLLGMPRPEVAALRAILAHAGAVVDLPWWLWTSLYLLLATLSLAFVLRPATTAKLRKWFARLRVRSIADVTRRLLSGAHIGLLAIALVALATPAALGPTLQRRLAAAYTVALQHRFEAQGELDAYTQIRQQFTGAAASQPLVQLVTEISVEAAVIELTLQDVRERCLGVFDVNVQAIEVQHHGLIGRQEHGAVFRVAQGHQPEPVVIPASRARIREIGEAVGEPALLEGFVEQTHHDILCEVKDTPSVQLAGVLRRVAAGERVIDPKLALATLEMKESPLSERETDVLRRFAAGADPAEIAAELFLSYGTVRNYLASSVTKVGGRNRMDAVRIAGQAGWL